VLTLADEYAAMRTATLTQSSFSDAAKAWLETRKPYIGPRTYSDYVKHIKTLTKFFSELKLTEIDSDHLREYQRMRMVRAGASLINREISTLQQMLKRIGRWAELAPNYQALPMPKESPHRALTPIEEERLYRVGASNPNWEVAYCCFVLCINTTAHWSELSNIRLCDVNQEERTFWVNKGKNETRCRLQPMNNSAWRAMEHLLKRAKSIGVSESWHYLVPFRVARGKYDPERPATSCRSALREMLAMAGIKVSFYSFRHHAITKLLENSNVSEGTAVAMAGHIDKRMLKRYSHTRIEAKRAAVMALERIAPKPAVEPVRIPPKRRRTIA
jgi:integrase